MPDQDALQQAADRQRAEQQAQTPPPMFADLTAAGQQESERAQINQDPGYLAGKLAGEKAGKKAAKKASRKRTAT